MIWNLEKKLLISNIKLNGNVSAHSLAYMHDFKSLAIATFGNEIALYNIYNDDVSLMGHLVGHITTVTALGTLNDSPLFISCDEVGVIKTWDVRFQTCIQTVFTNPSIQIRKFINLDSDKFVGMERRLVWFRYEDKLTVNSNGIKIHRNYPIGIEFNKELNEIYLCTKTDIRCLDMITGKVKRVISIFNSDYENTGVEIDHFGLSVDRRHFIICLSNGKMSLHLVRDGKFMRKLFKHKNVIANTTVDRKNKYIVSAGWDGQIIIQKDNTEKKSLHRRLKKANLGKPINILKLCHETNALATVSHSEVFVWTYSSMTLLGSFECDSREVLAVEFILDIPFIATLDETSCIKVWSFKTEDRSTFLDPILCIKTGVDLGDQLYIHKIERCRLLEQEPDDPPTKFWFSDIKARNGRSMTVLSAQEYNSHDWLRRFNQDHKICTADEERKYSKPNYEDEIICMYVTTQNGSIYSFDIQEIYEYIKEFDDTVNKIDEMKGIVLKDDHELIIKRNTFHTEKPFYPNDIPKLFWGAFKNDVDCIQYNSINNSGILTAFNNSNGTFKIFNLLGKEICRCNIDLIFPSFWKLPISHQDIVQEKYLQAMRMQMRLRASGACTIRIRKHLSSTKNIVPLSIIEPSSSLPDLHRNNPKTFKDLLGIVKKNSANREPCNIPLRRIEAKRRSLLHENETLTMHLDKLIANTTLKIENLEKYGLKGLEEDTEAKKMDFMETAVLGSKEKSGPKQEGFEIMYQELYEELTKPNLTDRKYDKFWKDIKKIKKNMPREGHSERRDKEPQSFAKVRTCLNGATLSMRTLDNLNKYFIKNNPESLKKGISKKKRKRKQSEANFAGYLEEPSIGLGHDRIINKRGSIDTTIYSKKSYSSQSQYPKLPSVRKEKKKDLKMTQLLTKESIKEDIIPKFG